jgi:nucleotide-binding universal stress UspA family protein
MRGSKHLATRALGALAVSLLVAAGCGSGTSRTATDATRLTGSSPPAIAAANLAISLARERGAAPHFVTVTEPDHHAVHALRHVTALAEEAGLSAASTTTDGGHAFEVLLRVAAEWEADVIVMGRSDRRRPGQPYVGSQTEHVLEFADIPVLVVPR